MKTTVGDETTV